MNLRARFGVPLLVLSAVIAGFPMLSNAMFAAGLAISLADRPRSTVRTVVSVLPVALLAGGYIVSGLLVGSMSPTPQFLLTEGRIFVSFLVLAICLAPRAADPENAGRLLLLISGLGLFSVLLFVLPPTRHLVVSDSINNQVFVGLGSSHHVTAFVFGAVGACAIGAKFLKNWQSVFVLSVCLLVGLLTTSRTLLLALVATPILYIFWSSSTIGLLPRARRLGIGLLGSSLLIVLMSATLFTPCSRCPTTSVLSLPTVDSFSIPDSDAADIPLHSELSGPSLGGREANVLLRVRAWERAVGDGIRSPAIGVGAFRFNDEGRNFYRAIPGISLVTSATDKVHSDFGAHNFYLQVFSELGLVGLAAGVAVLGSLTRVIRQSELSEPAKAFLVALIWFSGLVSNSVLAPAISVALLVPSLTTRWNVRSSGGASAAGLPPRFERGEQVVSRSNVLS